jgi:acetylglutamate kinase
LYFSGNSFSFVLAVEIAGDLVVAANEIPQVTKIASWERIGRIVQLNALGVPAIGLSGRNARMVVAKPVPELGRVGLPVKVRADLVRSFLDRKLAPIFASIASDGKGGALNINADEMASAIAVALKARRLILFTDVPGVLDASKRTIPAIRFAESRKLIQDGVITGGMIPKIESSFGAIKKGVGEIWILQGRLPLKDASGTVLTSKSSTTKHPFA